MTALVAACSKTAEPAPPAATSNASVAVLVSAPPVARGKLAGARAAPERVVAVGDLHGDIASVRRAFRLAGAVDAQDAWIGGKLVVVQTGDLIDRGDDDRAILDLTDTWKTAAQAAGGELIELVGNHEIMNAQLDFRYVTPGAYRAFSDVTPKDDAMAQREVDLEREKRGRASAFLPGGPYAKMLSRRPVVARVGNTLFVHGGLTPKYAPRLDAINDGARAFFSGEVRDPPKDLLDQDGPVWTRELSGEPTPTAAACADLDRTLGLLDAKRLVMGHTVQKDISAACSDKAWRIDVGMSRAYHGPIEVLEFKGDVANVLKEH